MLYHTSSHDSFSDAFFILKDRLMFASLYGRDANLLSLLATLTQDNVPYLGFSEPGSERKHPVNTTAHVFTRLEKRMTKINTHNYGVLVHAFLYAQDLTEYDRDEKTAWILLHDVNIDIRRKIWTVLSDLSDIPLLDCWADTLIDFLQKQEYIRLYHPGITSEAALVNVQACFIRIPEDFEQTVTSLLKNRQLKTA